MPVRENAHDPAATREGMKSLAVRLLLGALLTLVIPGTALLASAVAPDEWLAFQTVLHVVALLSGLIGAAVTLLALSEGVSRGRRMTSRIVSDEGPRWGDASARAVASAPAPGRRPHAGD